MFMVEQRIVQAELLRKFGAVTTLLNEYTEGTFYEQLTAEKESLRRQFAKLQQATAQSQFYSAKVLEISNFMANIGSEIDLEEKDLVSEQREFVRTKLDFDILYNSGFWHSFIESWLVKISGYGDLAVVADLRQVLAGIGDEVLREKFMDRITVLFYRYGKEGLLSHIGMEDLLSPGNKAPELTFGETKFVPAGSIIIFYESGCPSCEQELMQLRLNFRELGSREVRVISIAADRDAETFFSNANRLPWPDRYCDYLGIEGENFKKYNVIGTPVIFAVDKTGTIIGRYAKLSQYLEDLKISF
jgi:hypothetical protein